jgi:hypothetical protein
MPVEPIKWSGTNIDLSKRVVQSSAVVGSPALAAETIVCTLPALDASVPFSTGVFLSGVVSFTVGTSGTAITVRIRQGAVAGSGTVVASTGAITGGVAAGNLLSQDLQGFDTAPAAGQVYSLQLTVTGGAAASTVSQTNLTAIAV